MYVAYAYVHTKITNNGVHILLSPFQKPHPRPSEVVENRPRTPTTDRYLGSCADQKGTNIVCIVQNLFAW